MILLIFSVILQLISCVWPPAVTPVLPPLLAHVPPVSPLMLAGWAVDQTPPQALLDRYRTTLNLQTTRMKPGCGSGLKSAHNEEWMSAVMASCMLQRPPVADTEANKWSLHSQFVVCIHWTSIQLLLWEIKCTEGAIPEEMRLRSERFPAHVLR